MENPYLLPAQNAAGVGAASGAGGAESLSGAVLFWPEAVDCRQAGRAR